MYQQICFLQNIFVTNIVYQIVMLDISVHNFILQTLKESYFFHYFVSHMQIGHIILALTFATIKILITNRKKCQQILQYKILYKVITISPRNSIILLTTFLLLGHSQIVQPYQFQSTSTSQCGKYAQVTIQISLLTWLFNFQYSQLKNIHPQGIRYKKMEYYQQKSIMFINKLQQSQQLTQQIYMYHLIYQYKIIFEPKIFFFCLKSQNQLIKFILNQIKKYQIIIKFFLC
eukprot:TRINITY_DN328_c1_g1_i10.p2 TRINITY_DN328_c1_g1~~TRINITY_DN328_c1_g1_i10.p2  ORF type:complete len:231 (+),score=-33.61 TRINITY_DN328_c1_g1_i10:162-854(+)